MGKILKVTAAVLLSIAFVGISLSCFSEDVEDMPELIAEAKACIQKGDGEKAVSVLDAAFELADSAGDHAALMEIGDLYINADPSLDDRAMKAWTAAGRSKCR